MAEIDIRRFVDINIKYHKIRQVISTRDTVVILSSEALPPSEYSKDTYSSLEEWNDYYDSIEEGVTKPEILNEYMKVFYDNSDNKVKVIAVENDVDSLKNTIKALSNELIVVAYTGDEGLLRQVAIARSSDTSIYGINQKILIGRLEDATSALSSDINNYVIKISEEIGAEMTIAAYLTEINIDEGESVKDYCYTLEKITPSDDDDTLVQNVINNNFNVDINLANSIRNIGGNMVNGLDITNQYVLIILHQTLTDRLINLLLTKIKGDAGVSAIHSVIDAEMVRYINNGYLSVEKIWDEDDFIVTYNGKQYIVVKKGTPLQLGYIIKTIPLSDLTNDDKIQRKIPPIYIVLADNYGIRKITLNGEII